MPRNSSGTETLPIGNPVTSGTTIASTWGNATMGDIAAEITNSLDRNGRGGMLAPLRVPDGTVATPTIAFTSETGSGWFRESAGVLKCAILGVWRLMLTATGIQVNGTIQATDHVQIKDSVGGHLVSISPTVSMGADYNITLPAALPASKQILQMDAAGVVSTRTVGQQVSSASGAFSTSSGSMVDVTNLTVTLTTSGRPVLLILQPDGTNLGYIGPSKAASATADMILRFARGGVRICDWDIALAATGSTGVVSQIGPTVFLDVVAAGTYTYKVQASGTTGSTATVANCVLVAFEL